ncbi:hypothetical protein ACWER9_25735 [Micromonospora sp. NPDC003944]
MVRGSDLGWWGKHPYVYMMFTTTAAVACWTTVLVATFAVPEAAIGTALCGALFGVLMTVAAVYAWHWLLRGRHRDRRANDRTRWQWDMALLRAGWVFLWLIFLGLLTATVASLVADDPPREQVIPLAIGTVVAGAFVLVPSARRRLTGSALEHWRSPDGRIRPPRK